MKKFLYVALIFVWAGAAGAAEVIDGVWKTIDDETGEPKSLVQIYEYEGKRYGRVIKLFKNPDTLAKGVKGSPKIVGLDVIWDMEDVGEKYKNGKILDPKKGKIYNVEIWRDGEDVLIVRGKIGPFGRNQKWIKDDEKELVGLTPDVPEED